MKTVEVSLSDVLHAALLDFAAAHGITPAGAAARMVAVALGVGAMEGDEGDGGENARLHPEQPAAGCDRVRADVRPGGPQ